MLQTIDTRSRQVLPPIRVAPSPVPQFRYRRTKKAAVHYADLRSDLVQKPSDEQHSILEDVAAKVKSRSEVLESRNRSQQKTPSRVSSAKSNVSDDDIVKSLLAEAGWNFSYSVS